MAILLPSQAGRNAAQPDLSLRRRQAGQRILHDILLSLLRPGDRLPAVLQRLRSTSGPFSPYSGVLAKFITQMLRGKRRRFLARLAEPRLYFCGQCSRREFAGLQSPRRGSRRESFQCGHGPSHRPESDLRDSEKTHWLLRRSEIWSGACRRRKALARGHIPRPEASWLPAQRGFRRRSTPHHRMVPPARDGASFRRKCIRIS